MLLILGIALLTIAAGAIGTITGFGTSTIMVPVLLLFLPLPQTLLLVGIIHFFADLWKIALFRQGVRWKLIFGFGIPGVALSFLGARLVFAFPEYALSRTLGALLILYVLFLFWKPQFKLHPSMPTAVSGGALSGFLAGIFGVGGAVRGAFLSAFDLPKAVYIATSGAIGIAIDASRLATYIAGGTRIGLPLQWGLLFFIPASYAGALLAQKIVGHIPQKRFRIVVAVFLLLVGVRLLFAP